MYWEILQHKLSSHVTLSFHYLVNYYFLMFTVGESIIENYKKWRNLWNLFYSNLFNQGLLKYIGNILATTTKNNTITIIITFIEIVVYFILRLRYLKKIKYKTINDEWWRHLYVQLNQFLKKYISWELFMSIQQQNIFIEFRSFPA